MDTALLTWWSIAHTLSGIGFGVLFNYKNLKKIKPLKSSSITLFLLILWEFFERYALSGIEFGRELMRNRIADVVIGFGAFSITYYMLKKHPIKLIK